MGCSLVFYHLVAISQYSVCSLCIRKVAPWSHRSAGVLLINLQISVVYALQEGPVESLVSFRNISFFLEK